MVLEIVDKKIQKRRKNMKISKDDVIQSILILIKEEFEGNLSIKNDVLKIAFHNGQNFELSVKEL